MKYILNNYLLNSFHLGNFQIFKNINKILTCKITIIGRNYQKIIYLKNKII